MRRMRWVCAVLFAAMCAGARGEEPALFPFVLPWNDASTGVTDMSGRLARPAGRLGHVRAAADGHLYEGSKRIRFFGVDIAFGADVPTHAEAEAISARLARFGVNIVRFHIMDSRPFPDGILLRGSRDTRHLDPEGLDRLDYFVAQLNKRGVYADLNLLNYRWFNAADGLPADIEKLDFAAGQPRHAIGFFDEAVLGLQKEYARALLTHRNPYTGHTYTDQPGVAFVEINNENGLLHAWLSGWVDAMPEVFTRQLQARWNDWLKRRYATDASLTAAWRVAADPLGAELLRPGAGDEWSAWNLQRNAGAEATMVPAADVPGALRAELPAAPAVCIDAERQGTGSWSLLLNRPGFGVRQGQVYTLSFWAKADAPCDLWTAVYQTGAPYASVGLRRAARLTTEWSRFEMTFVASRSEPGARVTFGDFANHLGKYWLAGVSFRPGRPAQLAGGESLTAGTVPVFTLSRYGASGAAAQNDWRRFLWETEDRYWQGMYAFLKKDLGLKSLVIGTAVGNSTPVIMSGLDVVDGHAYWEHPRFPGRPWDPANWLINQRSMVNERGGILTGLAASRVQGKPRAVTEYGEPFPNGYGVEGYLLLAAYGALQDWDYVSCSRYSQTGDWDLRSVRGYFDIHQHPAKMVSLLPAAALFARADVRPAREQVVVGLDKERELALLAQAEPWQLITPQLLGLAPETMLTHRVAISTSRTGRAPAATAPPAPAGPRYVSDTGELCWDLSVKDRGVVTVNAPASKAVIGWGAGRRFDLGGVTVEPGPTRQSGWSAITVTAMSGDLGRGASRLLVTATGVVENTNMVWKNAEHTTLGADWGTAPTLAEGIPARITLPAPATRVRAWALDERGQRREPIPVTAAAGHAVLAIGPQWRTLWYEVEVSGAKRTERPATGKRALHDR